MKILKKFLHNFLGWGYPTKILEKDSFQPVYQCECGVELAKDSQGNWFHLNEPKKI